MLTAEDVYEGSPLRHAEAGALAELWNLAYPVMRDIMTRYIESYRRQIENEAWNVDPASSIAEYLRQHTPSEDVFRRKLRTAEKVRQELGQLDRATHRACTRSPGGFSVTSAYRIVRSVLNASSISTEKLAVVYRLAASLAEAEEVVTAERIAWHERRKEESQCS